MFYVYYIIDEYDTNIAHLEHIILSYWHFKKINVPILIMFSDTY